MALKDAPQVVNGLRRLFQDGYLDLRCGYRVRTTAIQALLSAWYDLELPNGALRDTLAAVGIGPAYGYYDLRVIGQDLFGDDSRLSAVANRALEQADFGEVRVCLADADVDAPGQMFLAVDVPKPESTEGIERHWSDEGCGASERAYTVVVRM